MDLWELARLLLEGVLTALSGNGGPLLQAISWLAMVAGSFRLVMKPIMMALHAIASATETKSDDEVLDKVEKSKIYVTMLFLLDWIVSVKLPQKQPEPQPEPVAEPPKE